MALNYFKVETLNDFNKIIIKKKDIVNSNFLSNHMIINNDIIINVSFKSFNSQYTFQVSEILINIDEIIILGLMIDPLRIFHQGYLDNFKLLEDNNGIVSWYALSIEQKYYYLRGCYFLSGIKNSIDSIKSKTIQIDFSNVHIELDIYYEIGRAFFGLNGYFGTEINSFLDCLYEIGASIKELKEPIILKINGTENFRKNFFNSEIFIVFYEEFGKRNFNLMEY